MVGRFMAPHGTTARFLFGRIAGRGTLMGDILRAANVLPDFVKAAQVHFVETSPALRAAQKQAVPHATWHDDVATLPAAPTYWSPMIFRRPAGATISQTRQ